MFYHNLALFHSSHLALSKKELLQKGQAPGNVNISQFVVGGWAYDLILFLAHLEVWISTVYLLWSQHLGQRFIDGLKNCRICCFYCCFLFCFLQFIMQFLLRNPTGFLEQSSISLPFPLADTGQANSNTAMRIFLNGINFKILFSLFFFNMCTNTLC